MYCRFRKRYSQTKEEGNSGLQLNTATFQDINQLLKKKKKKHKSTMYLMILGNMVKRLKINIAGPKGYKETQQKFSLEASFKKLAEDRGKLKKKNRSRLLSVLT